MSAAATMQAAAVQAHLKRLGNVAIVVGTGTPAGAIKSMSDLGSGWRMAIERWQRIGFPFAVLLLDSPDRIRRAAPVCILARDAEALLEALEIACERLSGTTCAWISLVSGPAHEAVQAFLASTAVTAGYA
jgi:hypothetical protein